MTSISIGKDVLTGFECFRIAKAPLVNKAFGLPHETRVQSVEGLESRGNSGVGLS